LVGKEGLEFFEKMQAETPFETRAIGLRGRLMDDIMVSSISKYNVKQIVNAACGVDTIAWRIAFQPDVTYFELDFPEMLQWKQAHLKDEKVKCNYKAVEADLRDPGWPQKLIDAGFDGKSFLSIISLLYIM
jgi:methyltransferase (TIGR00027 family)